MASTPPVDENAPPAQAELLFPHFADGDGYSTQFILLNAGAASSGTLSLRSTAGLPLDLGLR